MRRAFRLGSSSSPLLLSVFLVGMTALAAACSGSNNSDDDDDGGDGGDSGESGSGGSSAKGGTSSAQNGGTSGSTSGSSGTGSGSFLSDCQDVCDRASTCPDTDPAACVDSCTQLNTLVSSNVCKAQIETLYDCGGTTSDLCSETACETEANAFADCIIDYCTNNTSAAICGGGV